MNTRTCCREAPGWLAPSIGLALIPKCPMCVAGYVAAISGVGISMSMAARVRFGMLILCITALTFVTARAAIRMWQAAKSFR